MTTVKKTKKGTRTESSVFMKVSAIKKNWTPEEKLQRAKLGMERRSELERLLFGFDEIEAPEWLAQHETQSI